MNVMGAGLNLKSMNNEPLNNSWAGVPGEEVKDLIGPKGVNNNFWVLSLPAVTLGTVFHDDIPYTACAYLRLNGDCNIRIYISTGGHLENDCSYSLWVQNPGNTKDKVSCPPLWSPSGKYQIPVSSEQVETIKEVLKKMQGCRSKEVGIYHSGYLIEEALRECEGTFQPSKIIEIKKND